MQNDPMANEFTIRKATMNDLDVLLQFEQGIINAERPFDPTLVKEFFHAHDLSKMLSDRGIEMLVVEDRGKTIASGYVRIDDAKPNLQHKKFAYIGFMYTMPEYRGKGINAMIIDALKNFAKSKGLTEMRLEVYFKNETAIKAYEKFGFEKHIVEMRMNIEQ
jgi:ribosomal protein S18 acetylase RimI-like enzyme